MIGALAFLVYLTVAALSGLGQTTTAEALGNAWGKKASAKPTKIYLCLCTTVPTASSKGSTIVEATGATGYLRVEVPVASIAEAVAGATSTIETSAEIVSGAISGGSATVIGFAVIADAATVGEEGRMVAWGTCTSVVISATQQPWKVAAKGLKAELTS